VRRVLFWLVVLVGLIAIIGALSNNPRHRTREPVSPSTSAATAQPPATPNVTHASLVGSLIAERSGSGLTISGMTNGLPAGTKMWVEIIHQPGGPKKPISGPQDDKVIIAVDGRFRANLSNRDGSVFRPGSYTIMITAYFNSGWQTVDVLRKAGVELDSQGRSSVRTDPKAIPESLDFETDDPEFPKVGRHLKILREVKLGAVTADQAAIDAVTGATLLVQGRGRSRLAVGKSVDLFASMGGFKPIAWSAALGPDAKWVVTLDCIDGEKQEKAQWSYDQASKVVRYLNPLAKTLSYTPPY